MKTKFVILIALVLILSFSLMSFSAALVEKIEASVANDMKFKVDGKMWQPLEADGSPLSPIIYKGRSYVPVRALLEDKNVKVGFDESTRTILLDYPKNEPDESTSALPLDCPESKPLEVDKINPFVIRKVNVEKANKEIIVYGLMANENFDIGEMPLTNEITMDLSDNVKILVLDKAINIKELTKDGPVSAITSGKILIEYNNTTKLITSINIDGEIWDDPDENILSENKRSVQQWGDPHEKLNGKHLKIIFSGPPWELKIKLKL